MFNGDMRRCLLVLERSIERDYELSVYVCQDVGFSGRMWKRKFGGLQVGIKSDTGVREGSVEQFQKIKYKGKKIKERKEISVFVCIFMVIISVLMYIFRVIVVFFIKV